MTIEVKFYPKVSEVLQVIENVTGYTIGDMVCKRRFANLVRVRHFAMAMCRELCPEKSSVFLGNIFYRNHTTILDGVIRHKERIAIGDDLELIQWQKMVLEMPQLQPSIHRTIDA